MNKFLTLRVTPPAHPEPEKQCLNIKLILLKIRVRKVDLKRENGHQQLPKSSPKPSKIDAKWRQEGARRAPKSNNNIDPTKKRGARHRVAPF